MKEPDHQRQLHMEQSRSLREEICRVILSLAVMVLLTVIVYLFSVPNPNMILITGLTVFTSLYGYPSGIACGSVMILYSMFFFSTDQDFLHYSPLNLQKMFTIILGVVLNVVFIGGLKARNNEVNRKIIEINQLLQLDNDSLETASITDSLTGVRNRFALRRDYNSFQEQNLHVMMLDLDNFKRLNDHYGHAIGDYALRHTGMQLSDCFGSSCCYRYGGDEFLIITKDLTETDFSHRVERLKKAMLSLRLEGNPLPVHFSGGYVYGRCELNHDLRLMLHQADHNLYRAKRRGKDHTMSSPFNRELAEELNAVSGETQRVLHL